MTKKATRRNGREQHLANILKAEKKIQQGSNKESLGQSMIAFE
jgi:hypothetical protein